MAILPDYSEDTIEKRIRIGRIVRGKHPSFDGFKKILVITPSTPYVLKNEKGQIMENLWQFSKVYRNIPNTIQRYSRLDQTIIWNHPSEIYLNETDKLTPEFFEWREKGFNNKYAVRYPVGRNHRSNVEYAIKDIDGIVPEDKKLNYIDSRKQIYLPLYQKLVQGDPKFEKLIEMLNKGLNFLIIEIDGPYEEKYNVDDNFIESNTMLATSKNLKIMLNDDKYPFGHGYCLAWALIEPI